MTRFGGWGAPGVGTIDQTSPREIFWGGDRGKGMILTQSGEYSGAIRDAGNTPTTDIRAGLLVAKLTSSGELEEWDSEASDGTEELWGVNPHDFRAIDFNANDADRVLPVVVSAPLKASQLLIKGTALTSHADEFLARRALHAAGCILDDDPQGYLAGASWRDKIHTGDLTLTSADNCTRYLCHSADADFTLPTAQPGLKFRFFMGEDFELQISSPASNFLTGNDQTGDGVTYTTAGEQIGVNLEVECVNIDIAGTNTDTWIVTRFVTPFSTDDYFAVTIDT